MSAIGSIGGSVQSQQLQELRRQGGPPGGGIPAEAFSEAAQAAGLDPSKVDAVRSQIESAVNQAVQGSTGGDRRAAVESAVDTVLKDNGVDPATFKKQLQGAAKKHRAHHGHHPHPKPATTSTGETVDPTDPVTNTGANGGGGLNVVG